MSVKISTIHENSIATTFGIKPNDLLVSINDNEIHDILDYRFYETEKHLKIKLLRDEKTLEINVDKGEYTPIGLEFETYLMDREKSCRNACVFCFVDQLPKGMRESLYFKDDDERLSFLFGNYITLTNVDDEQIDRVIKMKISPINVSVHTMDAELRVKMMKNRFAGEKLKYLKKLADAGIDLNCQLVLCPEINDGAQLEHSIVELMKLGDSVQSIACVPVGITKHREGLYNLRPYTKSEALETIKMIEKFGDEHKNLFGSRKVYASDEFYIIAGKSLPEYDFYEDFPQIENGVGMFRNLEEEVLFALEEAPEEISNKEINMVTGMAIYPLLNALLDEVRKKWHNVTINLIPVVNHFFGETIDVTGLVTGIDIINTLKNMDLKGTLFIPEVMLKADEDIFLDDTKLDELEEKVGIKTIKIGSMGQDIVDAIVNI